MKVVVTLPTLFSSKKIEFTKNKTRILRKPSQSGGIPYGYISYESIIKPKTKKTIG
jgi:hypothetical protein